MMILYILGSLCFMYFCLVAARHQDNPFVGDEVVFLFFASIVWPIVILISIYRVLTENYKGNFFTKERKFKR